MIRKMNDSHRQQLIETLHLFALQFSIHGQPGNHLLSMNNLSELVPSDPIDPMLVEIANLMLVLALFEASAHGYTFRLTELTASRFDFSVSRSVVDF